MKTPWTQYVTKKPELFVLQVKPENRQIFVVAGEETDEVRYCFTEPRRSLHVSTPSRPKYLPVIPHSFNLDKWSGSDYPKLFLHPVALLHLIATRKVPMTFVRDAGREMMEPTYEADLLLVTSCDLLDMLGVKQATVVFGTNFNLEVK
jgi:hypothetical protein